jgi:hypothetical protein
MPYHLLCLVYTVTLCLLIPPQALLPPWHPPWFPLRKVYIQPTVPWDYIDHTWYQCTINVMHCTWTLANSWSLTQTPTHAYLHKQRTWGSQWYIWLNTKQMSLNKRTCEAFYEQDKSSEKYFQLFLRFKTKLSSIAHRCQTWFTVTFIKWPRTLILQSLKKE